MSIVIPVLLVFLMVTWGGSFIAIKIGLRYLSPYELVLARFVPSAVLLWVIGRIPRRRHQARKGFWRGLSRRDTLGVLLVSFLAVPGYHFCLNFGETMIPAGWASLVISLNPACIMLLAALLLRERVGARQIAGIAIAFAGLLFIAFSHNLATAGSGALVPFTGLVGMAITLGAVLSWGSFTVFSKRLIRDRDPLTSLGWIILLGTLWLAPGFRLQMVRRMVAAPAELWWAAAFLSVGCTVIGFAIWFWVLERWEASRAGVFIYLVPLFALVIGRIMLREPIDAYVIIGAAVVLGGVFLAGRRTAESIG